MKGLYMGRRRRWSRLAGGVVALTVLLVLAAVGGRALGAWGTDLDLSALWRLMGVRVDTTPGPEDVLSGGGDSAAGGTGADGGGDTVPGAGGADPAVVASGATFVLEVLYEKCSCLETIRWVAREGEVGLDQVTLESELARLNYEVVGFSADAIELQHRNTSGYCPVHADGVTLRWVDGELLLYAGRSAEALARPVVLQTLGAFGEAQLRGLLGDEAFAQLQEGQSFTSKDQAYRLLEGLTD